MEKRVLKWIYIYMRNNFSKEEDEGKATESGLDGILYVDLYTTT
jgi:hypothetical protein